MNFIKRFLTAFKNAAIHAQYDELADDLSKEDLVWLSQVLSSPTGQKLMNRWNNMVIRAAIDATRYSFNPRHKCGVARGMALLKGSIDSDYQMALSLAGAQSGKSETSQDEIDADDLELLLSQT